MKENLLKIINHYGIMPQLKHFNSEVFELTEAIFQYDAQKEACENIGCSRIHIDKCKEHIAEEIADVLNMVEQFKEYYHIDGNDILRIMNEKIDRTISRIEEGYYDK